mgnify:CR=1 FL=1
MSKILVIGAGGVSSVAIHKMAQLSNDFKEITLASRTIDNCKKIQKQIKKKYNFNINIEELDADNIHETSKIISKYTPELVVNLALPYQDLNIMQACLNKNVNYLDTANYEPRDEAKFEYKWQWELNNKFKEKNLMGLLGSGFDPGVTNVYTAYIKKHYLDEIHYLDILDCNGGNHGQHFATNFNPEINIREITQKSKFYKNGKWISFKIGWMFGFGYFISNLYWITNSLTFEESFKPLIPFALILVPVIEIYLLIKIGAEIGAITTILLIFTQLKNFRKTRTQK